MQFRALLLRQLLSQFNYLRKMIGLFINKNAKYFISSLTKKSPYLISLIWH